MFFIYIIVGILLGILIAWLCLKGKLQTTQQLDQQIINENKSLKQLNSDLLQEHGKLTNKLVEANSELKVFEAKKDEQLKHLKELEDYAETAGTALYDAAIKNAEANIELALTKMTSDYKNAEEQRYKEYENALLDGAKELQAVHVGSPLKERLNLAVQRFPKSHSSQKDIGLSKSA